MVYELEALPDGLLALTARELHRLLPGPTLIHLPGRQSAPLFVSVLLHGNEDSGWEAMRQLLQEFAGHELPRALSLFIGNVAAAQAGVRHLPEQPDYNRIWQGGESAEAAMAADVVASMARRGVFASIDLHNNTGLNPHYACINRLENDFLHLATLFSRTVVYFIRPDTVQSLAFSRLCPAVTVECGKVGQARGIAHAREFVAAALHLNHFPGHSLPDSDYDLYHTVATMRVPESVEFSFTDTTAGILFPADLDSLNFRELPPGTRLARVSGGEVQLEVRDELGRLVTDRYFANDGRYLTTRLPVMPSMLTLDETVIRQDCLGYLMERLALPQPGEAGR
jgi:succinylglutamate desuccinylase